jgi:predicted RNA methylase
MSSLFEIEPIEKNLPAVNTPSIQHETLEVDLKKDYESSRDTYYDLLEKGKTAFEDIISIARESEKARDFEVAAAMFRNILDTNEKLINMHKIVRDITNYKKSDTTIIDKAVFVGSPLELNKMLKEFNVKDIEV